MRPTAKDIQGWNPMDLSEVTGNDAMVEYYRQCIRAEGQMLNTLNTGDSRSGKGGTLAAFARTLICERRSLGDTRACGECRTCLGLACTHGEEGIFAQARPSNGRDPVHLIMVDCTSTSPAKLLQLFDDIRYYDQAIIILDEVHRFEHRKMDEMLLKPMEMSGKVWIANAVSVKNLDRMFLNRFAVKLRTSLPSVDKLSEFLADRCIDWEIEWDDEATIIQLAKRSNLITGKALQVLGRAVLNGRRLTSSLVADHMFDENDS